MLALILSTAAAQPLYRVCVAAATPTHQVRWSLSRAWPWVRVWHARVVRLQVHALHTREPSWMWERPLQMLPWAEITVDLDVQDSAPAPRAGEVLYLDAPSLPAPPDLPETVHIAPPQALSHTFWIAQDHHARERCQPDALARAPRSP